MISLPNLMVPANPSGETVVFGGVDTHAATHTVAAVSQHGVSLGHATFPADPAGYHNLVGWLDRLGEIARVAVEGTGSYGAGLAECCRRAGVEVFEVSRPSRRTRRGTGKSDPVDAENAARAALAGADLSVPKSRNGYVESLRVIQQTRRGAVQARTAALNTLNQLILTAPADLRAQLDRLSRAAQVEACARLRPGPDLDDPLQATKAALRRLARRITDLEVEIDQADADLDTLTRRHRPDLVAEVGVGPVTAAQLLISAGDNPDRMASPAAFVALCGANPIPASSGQTVRHRLNRGGDRQANSALHTIAVTRLRCHPETQAYADRLKAHGKTGREIRRCLKRYLARHLYHLIAQPARPASKSTPTRSSSSAGSPPQKRWPGDAPRPRGRPWPARNTVPDGRRGSGVKGGRRPSRQRSRSDP
jgi:transposase